MWNPRDMKHWKKQSQPASDYYQHSGYTCAANRPQTKRSHRRLPLLGFLDTPHVHHQGPWATTKSATQTRAPQDDLRSEEHTSELQSRGHLVCRLLLEKKNDFGENSDIRETGF